MSMFGIWDMDDEAPAVMLSRWRVRWWDSADWNWYDLTVLAESEKQCREHADKITKPEFRVKHNSVGDSLQVIFIERATLPIVLSEQ